jgi:hypothetical protein
MVYAMLIEKVITLREYDARSAAEWPHRIPKIHSADLSERLGDCIYDFSSGSPYQRGGVHGAQNIKRDLSGENVLISRHFYYFGSRAIEIPQELKPICPKTQGHRRALNDEHFTRFVEWVSGLPNARGQVQGWPDYIVKWDDIAHCDGCVPCANDSDSEEEVDEE